jgi:DNA invertase Pin-like site-specific DNA recombinase
VAYGYVRVAGADETRIGELRHQLRRICRVQRLLLITVCCDRFSDGSELTRPGFAAALDALALPEAIALIVPNLDHLSPHADVREALARSVRRTGAKIITAHESADTSQRAEDRLPPAMVRWCATAVRELARHRPVDGLCRVCGAAWPCPTCGRAELALGSL